MTQSEQATRLIEEFGKITNISYSVLKPRIRKNVIVQNAIIHCNLIINELNENTEEDERMKKWWSGVIEQLKIQENE